MSVFDSTGNSQLCIGCIVDFRGQEYTIKGFKKGQGILGTDVILFEEPQHTDEIANELSVNFVRKSW